MAGEGSRVGAEDGRWLSAREGWVAEAVVHLVLLVLVLAGAAGCGCGSGVVRCWPPRPMRD